MDRESTESKPCACRNVKRCRTAEAGKLFLWFPIPHTLKKVTSYLNQFALNYEVMQERPGLSLDCRPGQAQEIARNLAQLLAPREQSILCDVDCFKLYNDTYGHLAGDDVLRQVAGAIAQAVKNPNDLVARYGGEEFAVILPNANIAEAIAVAREIQANISGLQLSHPNSAVNKFIRKMG